MVEAWTVEHRPILYFLLRRYELMRWIVKGSKSWHLTASRWARIRAFLLVLGGHEGEICCVCGRKMEAVWWCPEQQLWSVLTDWTDGGGLACIKCFDRLAQEKGIRFIWKPEIDSSRE